MILYGFMGRLPITLCFLAPLIPGLILMALLAAVHLVMCRNIKTIYVPPKTSVGTYVFNIAKSGYKNFLTLLMPVIVLGGIYGGFFTPTEAASIAIFYCVIVSMFIYRAISPKQLSDSLLVTARDVGSVVCMAFFFLIVSQIFILQRVSESILAVLMLISENPLTLMLLINVLLFGMGMIISDGAGTIIAAVVLLPVAKSLGFDPYHFAAMVCVNLGMGMLTPPVASLLYGVGYLANLPLKSYIRRVMIFIIFAYIPTLLLTVFVPELSTFLPHLFMK
jgi:tripartite ATP-independent transporter DctM subunit